MRPTLLCIAMALGLGVRALAGNLNPPPGPVAPTPGPEPRIPINATNTPGDANSVYRIAAPGSYYLTGNMTGEEQKHGIEIAASDVSIDLMGFEMIGGVRPLDAIVAEAAGLSGIEIRNGFVRGWEGDGVGLLTPPVSHVRIEAIRAIDNDGIGIAAGIGSLVTECLVAENLAQGISVSAGSTVAQCIARSNGDDGIATLRDCTVIGCTASANTGAGIHVDEGCHVESCTSSDNTGHGITGSTGTSVSACTAQSNDDDGINFFVACVITGCFAQATASDGIQVSNDARVTGCSCDSNGALSVDGAGIRVTSSDCVLDGNNCTDNDTGIDVNLSGNLIIRNTCSGNTLNWEIGIGNVVGPIVQGATNAAVISGNTYAGTPGSTNPWANFTY